MKRITLYCLVLIGLFACKKEYGNIGRPKNNGEVHAEQVYNAWCAKTGKCILNEKVVHTINVTDYTFTKKVTHKFIYERRRDAIYAVMVKGSTDALKADGQKYWTAYANRVSDISKKDSLAKVNHTYQEFSDYNPLLVYSTMVEYTYYVDNVAYNDKFYVLLDKDVNFVDVSVASPDLKELATFDAMVPRLGESDALYDEYAKIKN